MNPSEAGCADTVYKLVGYDKNGVRRVWAADYDQAMAAAKCQDEVRDYIKRRPDTGPYTAWRFDWK